jgi:diaminopimelate decarboxylase
VLDLAAKLAAEGVKPEHLDLGGGFGIRYKDEVPPDIRGYCQALARKLSGSGYQVMLEPGRSIVGNAGVLLTRVEYLKLDKAKHFAIVDASMSELIRPALYDAYHEIVAVSDRGAGAPQRFDVAGPVCESTDVLGTDRSLAIEPGSLLAILSAGAYAMSMASNYNTRVRPAEVLVDAGRVLEVRARESLESLFALEHRLSDAPSR